MSHFINRREALHKSISYLSSKNKFNGLLGKLASDVGSI